MTEEEPRSRGGSRIGLALAGGGPAGALYEIGALRALDEALDGIDLNHLDVYVGVSAGSFIASCLANRTSTGQLWHAAFESESSPLPFDPVTFFTPAIGEFFGRSLMTPRLAVEAFLAWLDNPGDQTLTQALTRLSRALPVGFFDNEPIREYLERIFSVEGRTNDFRELRSRLVVVAADLDTGRAARFGDPGMEHVPVSVAVQASTALPGLYPPVEIDGHHYADGVLLKTLHASVALDDGADLLFCLNPIVPVDTTDAVAAGVMRQGKLINRGLPTVLSQTFRMLVHSRLAVGFAAYEPKYPGRDIILLEPGRDDYSMFFTNIFSFSRRKAICQHGYLSTLRQLKERREELDPVLGRHGARLRPEVLERAVETATEPAAPQGSPSRADGADGAEAGGPGTTLAVTRQLERTLERLELLFQEE